MDFLKLFHEGLIGLFAVINGMMLHLFLLHFPYGLEAFFISLASWDKLTPQIGYVVTITLLVMVSVVVLSRRLSGEWKNRILYLRMRYAHPAFNAFLPTRRQPFETVDLLKKFPFVKDSGFNHQVQVDTWDFLHKKYADRVIVINTRIHWQILRDLNLLAMVFLVVFLLGWLVNYDVSFRIVSAYLFLFVGQFLFLMLMARRVGFKLVDIVLGMALGIDDNKGAG
ncbi:MAG: hypothetical protein ABW168_23825 [Sedimenticola sp.]